MEARQLKQPGRLHLQMHKQHNTLQYIWLAQWQINLTSDGHTSLNLILAQNFSEVFRGYRNGKLAKIG